MLIFCAIIIDSLTTRKAQRRGHEMNRKTDRRMPAIVVFLAVVAFGLLGFVGIFSAANPPSEGDIFFAISRGDNELLRQILEKDSLAVYRLNESSRSTPLIEAVRGGNFNAAVMLVIAGAPVNSDDAGGWTPLHYAVMSNQGRFAKLLLRKGADVAAPDWRGVTPWHLAETLEMKELLRRYVVGEPPRLPNDSGETSHEATPFKLEDDQDMVIPLISNLGRPPETVEI